MSFDFSPSLAVPFGFGIFGIFFVIMSLLVLGIFLFVFIKIISQWNRNNHSPRLTVPATVIAKRGHTTSHHHAGEMHHHHHSTTYYVTFQVESGDRMELMVPDAEYGLLIEGDRGNLTFQGTRYLSFARI
ncbi:MAG: DUF2500 domain-containing protein [Clostridia bacterium]|nr:DUF2500 domain-containing protein [Clostridia bacterium]